jgi:hypothetical protein
MFAGGLLVKESFCRQLHIQRAQQLYSRSGQLLVKRFIRERLTLLNDGETNASSFDRTGARAAQLVGWAIVFTHRNVKEGSG